MIVAIAIVAWFGSGYIGAHFANRHLIRRYGPDAGCETCVMITTLGGPLGFLGAMLYLSQSAHKDTPA